MRKSSSAMIFFGSTYWWSKSLADVMSFTCSLSRTDITDEGRQKIWGLNGLEREKSNAVFS